MRNRLTRIGILLVIFMFSVFIISCFMNKETTENKEDMSETTLPVMSMMIGENQVNRLYGYTSEMQVDYMRDSLMPLDTDKTLTIVVKPYDHKIKSVTYELRSSDGSKVIENAKVKSFTANGKEQTASFTISNSIRMNQEYSLRFQVDTSSGTYYYYTRLIQRAGINTDEYINFVQNFYQTCLDKENAKDLAAYLEADATASNNSFHNVTIHSSLDQVSWGSLAPELYRKGIPVIKDINETTGSVSIDYMITAKDSDGNTEMYQVSEFYRLRYTQARVRMLDFERTVTQVFDANLPVIMKEGVNLGVASKDVQYVTNKNSDIVAFVQAGDLWTYNRVIDKMTRVFSFRVDGENDERADNTNHDIKIVRVGETGDLDFVVYGYMNRGAHEGDVGTCVYHYSSDQNVLEEKFFLPSTVSYEFLKENLDNLSYVSTQDKLYLILEGSLYQMNLDDKKYQIIKSGISKDCFVVSNTHAHAAWMEEMDRNNSATITEIDFETGNTRTITAAEGTKIKAIGFINEDLVYGIANDGDILQDADGNIQFAMNEIRIENFDGNLVKNYQQNGTYIMDVIIQQGLIELVRSQWVEDAYTQISSDHIMNNVQQNEDVVSVGTKITERQGMQIRLNFSQAIKNKTPLVVESKIMVSAENHTLNMEPESQEIQEYYVYAKGRLDGIYKNANDAIIRANEQTGVVLSRQQQYVWERGNQKTKITIDLADVPEEFKNGSLDPGVLQDSLGEAGTVLNLSGCALDTVLYQVSALRPVVAKISDTETVVIVGYDTYNTTLYNPTTGETYLYGLNDSKALFESAGNVFMSFIEKLD